MDKRGKRAAAKPARYQTTTSEEETPKRQRTSTAPRPSIIEDIQDLREILQVEIPTTSTGFSASNSSNIYMFQETSAASVPAPAAFTCHQDPRTSSAPATVIQRGPLQQIIAQTQPPDNG